MIVWFLCFSWNFWLKHNAEVSRNYPFKQIPKVMHFPQDKLLYDYKPLYILYLGLLLVLVIALYLYVSDTQIPFIFQVSFFFFSSENTALLSTYTITFDLLHITSWLHVLSILISHQCRQFPVLYPFFQID